MKIWCIEDDININDLVVYAMESSGYEVRGFVNYTEFEQAMGEDRPDLLILDVMLPDKDGMEILKELRENDATYYMPVIMLTAKTAESDRVRALDMGADDYVPKPFGVMELISRVRAVLRRTTTKSQESILVCGNVAIMPSRHRVDVNGVTVDLTLKEYNLLHLLISNKGQVFSRKQLMDKVWATAMWVKAAQ